MYNKAITFYVIGELIKREIKKEIFTIAGVNSICKTEFNQTSEKFLH